MNDNTASTTPPSSDGTDTPLTAQQAFDTACKGILAQGRASVDEDNRCAYRGLYNCKCAVGHLITDDEYSPDFENCAVLGLRHNGKLPKRLHGLVVFSYRAGFLQDLQDIHDQNRYANGDHVFIHHFRQDAYKLAARYKLSAAVLLTEALDEVQP